MELPFRLDGTRWTLEEYEVSIEASRNVGGIYNEPPIGIKLDHKPEGLYPENPCKAIELPENYHGAKFDKGKPMVSLVEPEFILGVAKVMTMGAEKYSAGSWKEVPDAKRRYKDALLRHLYADEEKDPESGLSHMLHAACNVMFLYWLENQDD